jgi:hypothetical protein
MLRRCLLFVFITLSFLLVFSQDTVRVMHYNLLYYGVNTGFCNQTNNNLQVKNDALRKIIAYAQPDIFTVNEISSNATYHQMILDSILNVNGINRFSRAALTNFSGTSIINGMFYDSEKFGIAEEYALVGGDRDINVYKMYYKTPELQWSTDTVFITFFVAHLSSGSGSQNEQNRENEAGLVMNHIATLPNPGNYIFQGDFNFYTSAEAGFQRIINNPNPNIRLYDPINKVGTWTDNETFAPYHTQSTHLTTDCFVGGGLDDRFDFIMTSLPVIMETFRVKYIPGSYVALGQDGLHFNKALIDLPVNTSAPAHVIQALYDLSDHLPVYLDLRINQTPANIEENQTTAFTISFENPVTDNLRLQIYSDRDQNIEIRIFDLSGRILYSVSENVYLGFNEIELTTDFLQQGLFLMQVAQGNGLKQTARIVRLY